MGGAEGHLARTRWLSRYDGLFLLRSGIYLPAVCRWLSPSDVEVLHRCLDDTIVRRRRILVLQVSHGQHELAVDLQAVLVAPDTSYPLVPDDLQHQLLDR